MPCRGAGLFFLPSLLAKERCKTTVVAVSPIMGLPVVTSGDTFEPSQYVAQWTHNRG